MLVSTSFDSLVVASGINRAETRRELVRRSMSTDRKDDRFQTNRIAVKIAAFRSRISFSLWIIFQMGRECYETTKDPFPVRYSLEIRFVVAWMHPKPANITGHLGLSGRRTGRKLILPDCVP